MPNLFPQGYEEEVVTLEEITDTTGIGYRESVYFDTDTGDFVRDGQYRVKSATGIEAWEQWCRNCLLTERGAYPCYSDKFGIATYDAFRAETREKAESILTREICESLANDPYGRTEYVSDVEFKWHNSDSLNVDVTVVGIEDVTIDITAVLDIRMR